MTEHTSENVELGGGPPTTENPSATENSQVAERNLPQIASHLAAQVADGSIKAAAGYAVGKGLEKVFGDRPPEGKDQAQPPSADPPADADPPA